MWLIPSRFPNILERCVTCKLTPTLTICEVCHSEVYLGTEPAQQHRREIDLADSFFEMFVFLSAFRILDLKTLGLSSSLALNSLLKCLFIPPCGLVRVCSEHLESWVRISVWITCGFSRLGKPDVKSTQKTPTWSRTLTQDLIVMRRPCSPTFSCVSVCRAAPDFSQILFSPGLDSVYPPNQIVLSFICSKNQRSCLFAHSFASTAVTPLPSPSRWCYMILIKSPARVW